MPIVVVPVQVWVNTIKVKSPNSLKVEPLPITEGERLGGGKMSVLGVAGKLKITLPYTTLKFSDLSLLLGQTWDIFKATKKITQTVTFIDCGASVTIETYFAPFSYTQTPRGNAMGRVEDVTITFIEL